MEISKFQMNNVVAVFSFLMCVCVCFFS